MWEYRTFLFGSFVKPDGFDDKLNELGREGWELVGTLSSASRSVGGAASGILFFKRPLS